MNLNQLLYFSVTARHQHFTRAAEELFISQPSLSYAIASLEDELGIPLFEKKGRNVALTKQGALFLTHVERALSEIQQGREALMRMNNEIENHIEIAAFSASIGNEALPELLRDFTQNPQNSDVQFRFTQCNDDAMLDGLKSMKFDVAFPSRPFDDPDIESTPLFSTPMVALMPHSHPLARHSAITTDELAQYPLILGVNMACSRKLQQLLPDASIACRVHEHSAMLGLAAEGFGIAVTIPTREAQFYPLKSIPITAPECRFTTYIAYKKARYLPAALDRFIRHVQRMVAETTEE